MGEMRRKDGRPIQSAESVKPYICGRPECGRVHIALYDENDEPFAHFVLPDGFMKAIEKALYLAAVIRDDEGT